MSEAQAMTPIDMVLFCPACGVQHIDEPEEALIASGGYLPPEPGDEPWANPPHRSHLCHGCGHIWRPADVPTNGVAAVKTKGAADSALATPGRKIMTSPNTPVDAEAMELAERLLAKPAGVSAYGCQNCDEYLKQDAASALSRLLAERREMLEALDWLLACVEASDADREERLGLAKAAARTVLVRAASSEGKGE